MKRLDAYRFPATIFLSAFLLFQVQPMMGRYVLPWFGGGPAVWTHCLLFFQSLLLAGYAYAHWLGSRENVRRQAWTHIALLSASMLFLPIGPRAGIWKPLSSGDPSGRILLLLAATVGGPYLMLSASSFLSATAPIAPHTEYPLYGDYRRVITRHASVAATSTSRQYVQVPFTNLVGPA